MNEPELPPEDEIPRGDSACDSSSQSDKSQAPEIRAAFEPTCCGSGCDDCPF